MNIKLRDSKKKKLTIENQTRNYIHAVDCRPAISRNKLPTHWMSWSASSDARRESGDSQPGTDRPCDSISVTCPANLTAESGLETGWGQERELTANENRDLTGVM